MTYADQKREMIDALTDGELRGWWLVVFTWRVRPAREGERAALLARAAALNLTMKGG